MLIDSFDTNERVLIIAEIGNNHEGSFNVARELIEQAAAAGADAVKFQTFRTEHYVSSADEARFARLKGFELSADDFTRLAEKAEQHNLIFLSTPFDLQSAAMLDAIVPAFKIASGDNTFHPLIEAVAGTGKPILMSTGLASRDELRETVSRIREAWGSLGVDPGLGVLHCVSSYPVPPEEANLGAIRDLESMFDCTPGYSDHTLGIEAAALAVAVGARIIEKHFTLRKDYSDFRDHQLSADPAELAELVQRIRRIEAMLGPGEEDVRPCERDAVGAMRRSIAARRDLAAGTELTRDDITWVRPGGGVAPGREYELLGCRLTQDVRQGIVIHRDMLETQAVS